MPDREEILRRFEARLDEALAAEDAPRGIPQELLDAAGEPADDADFYAVEAALTALTQEVKLQGRSFKQLSEAVAPLVDVAPALPELLDSARRQAEEHARGEVLDALLDLRDRLARGAAAARQSSAAMQRGFWLPRLLGRARQTVAALQEGYDLTSARLDEVLAGFGVHEIECLGRIFDAHSMQAAATEQTARVPEGTVLEVYRGGYEINGEIYRVAQVKVARREEA